jgi:DNA modification methylase
MLKIEYVNINTIKPYENNAKLHPQEQIEQIKKSIQEFGNNDPIAVWHDEIVEGHGRYEALKQLGEMNIPIIRLDELSDEQRKAYTLVHNKLTMNSDFDLGILNDELLDIDTIDMSDFGFDIDLDMEQEQEIVEDEVPEVPEEPKAKLGDIYQLGNHRLMCGDSTSEEDVAKLMNGVKADMVMTDPPYNVDYSSKNEMLNYSDKGSRIQKPIENDNIENFEQFLFDAYKNMADNTKEGGAFYIWHSEKEDITFKQQLKKAGVYIHQTLIWVKNNFVLGRMDYQPKHEPCLYGWKEGAGHYFVDDRSQSSVIEDEKPDIKKMKKDELVKLLEEIYSDKVSTTVIKENKPQVSDLHPTMKPIKLLARLIKNSSKKEETVLDLFGGSGSTLIACEQLNRKCYMMEYDPHYIDVIIQRWENFTGEKAIKIN